jgi:hypothetical protein
MQTKATKQTSTSHTYRTLADALDHICSLKREQARARRELAAWRFRHDDEQYSPRHDQIVHKGNPIAEAMNDDGIN